MSGRWKKLQPWQTETLPYEVINCGLLGYALSPRKDTITLPIEAEDGAWITVFNESKFIVNVMAWQTAHDTHRQILYDENRQVISVLAHLMLIPPGMQLKFLKQKDGWLVE